MQVYQLSVVL